MDNQQVIDKLTKTCVCKAVSRLTIKQAIASGCKTVEEVWKKTNTGNGSCQGKRCRPIIQALLNEWDQAVEEDKVK